MYVAVFSVFLLLFSTASHSTASTVTYSYDDQNRLNRTTYDDGTVIEYSYDANSNRLTKEITFNFSASGIAPFTVNFIGPTLESIVSWYWDFGDGETSAEQIARHTYKNAGTYSVSLTTSGHGGSNTKIWKAYITVNDSGTVYCLVEWHNWFAVDSRETPMVGDFNGDGRMDIITFTRDNPNAVGDVYVALSDGTRFGKSQKWNDWFAINQDETVIIGDFNGDGKDDIATWLIKSTKQVYVATSTGSGMNTSALCLKNIGNNSDDVLRAGDVNGDGKCDLILFSRNTGKVEVARSSGSSFLDHLITWHNWFAVSTYERPEVGDVDGDGKADIITFCTDSPTAQGDVFVALSKGSLFGDGSNSIKWNDWFAVDPSQKVRIGDLNGDGLADFATFLPDPYNQVYGVYSKGNGMSDNYLIACGFYGTATDLPFLGDVNGDGKADLILFRQGEGKVYVMLQ